MTSDITSALSKPPGNPISVQVALYASAGSSWVYKSIQLRPFEQMQMSIDQLFNNAIGESDNFRLHVTGGPETAG